MSIVTILLIIPIGFMVISLNNNIDFPCSISLINRTSLNVPLIDLLLIQRIIFVQIAHHKHHYSIWKKDNVNKDVSFWALFFHKNCTIAILIELVKQENSLIKHPNLVKQILELIPVALIVNLFGIMRPLYANNVQSIALILIVLSEIVDSAL